jgi:hypothetical protein
MTVLLCSINAMAVLHEDSLSSRVLFGSADGVKGDGGVEPADWSGVNTCSIGGLADHHCSFSELVPQVRRIPAFGCLVASGDAGAGIGLG